MPKAIPPRETPIAGGTIIPAGQLVVIKDTNKVVVNPVAQTAAAFLAANGGTIVTTCSVADRWGAFPDTGLPIFDRGLRKRPGRERVAIRPRSKPTPTAWPPGAATEALDVHELSDRTIPTVERLLASILRANNFFESQSYLFLLRSDF
jgi:hypothetical protein